MVLETANNLNTNFKDANMDFRAPFECKSVSRSGTADWYRATYGDDNPSEPGVHSWFTLKGLL